MAIPFSGQKFFMPLGSISFSRIEIPPPFDFAEKQGEKQQKISNEINLASTESKKAALPDIFTTCPELRSFNIPLIFNQPVPENEFNLPRLAPKPRNLPPMQQSFLPRNIQTHGQPQQMSIKFEPNIPIIRPKALKFVPESEWKAQSYSLTELRNSFFTRRNGIGRVFPIKLYHALLITKEFPDAYFYTGVIWVTNTVFKVNAALFANLLGIHSVQGGLFHKQGNFTRHKYSQIMIQSSPEFAAMPECSDVDDFYIRLFTDPQERFTRDSEYNIKLDPILFGME
jgi:hypothetical protein